VATCFAGATLFFGELYYGLAKDSSLYMSAPGGIVLLIGLVALAVAARATFSWPHPAVTAVSIVGVALFAYVSGLGATGFLLWASVPYLFCTLASCFAPTRVAARSTRAPNHR